MRVLFTVFPATAHVHPIVPLAWALQNEGHEVRVAIHPDAVNLVTEAGLPAVPLGSREVLADAVAWNNNFEMLDQLSDFLALDPGNAPNWQAQWPRLAGMLGMFTPMVDDLVQLCRRWQPDLVVWDMFCVAAAVAARVTGAAHARFLWGQDNIAWFRSRQLEARTEDPVPGLMRPMLESYGLEYGEDLLLGQWTIDPMPEAMRLPLDVRYEALRRVPYNGNTLPQDWMHDRPSRPRVCLTLGIGGRGRQLFRTAGLTFAEVVEALAELDIELVATLHSDLLETVDTVPDNVRLVEYIPLTYLLPTCSAIIHHGGGGTFAAAVAARVPQLIVPMPFWGEGSTAAFMAERGAGLLIDSSEFGIDPLRKQLTRLLEDPELQNGADALRQELFRATSPHDMVGVLTSLTEQHRG